MNAPSMSLIEACQRVREDRHISRVDLFTHRERYIVCLCFDLVRELAHGGNQLKATAELEMSQRRNQLCHHRQGEESISVHEEPV